MEAVSAEKLAELLGTDEIPGTEAQQAVLRVRIGELVALNGEPWVRRHRGRLLAEWRTVLAMGVVEP